MIHEFLEDHLGPRLPHCKFEYPIKTTVDGVEFVGRVDCYDPVNGAIIDWKSRASFYKHNPPVQRHLDQLLVYMNALDVQYGQVIYVSKKDLEIRPWPEKDYFEFDEERFEYIVEKAKRVREASQDGVPTDTESIPFDSCGCWVCNNERLTI